MRNDREISDKEAKSLHVRGQAEGFNAHNTTRKQDEEDSLRKIIEINREKYRLAEEVPYPHHHPTHVHTLLPSPISTPLPIPLPTPTPPSSSFFLQRYICSQVKKERENNDKQMRSSQLRAQAEGFKEDKKMRKEEEEKEKEILRINIEKAKHLAEVSIHPPRLLPSACAFHCCSLNVLIFFCFQVLHV